MGDVVELDVVTTLDLPADRILRKAVEADLEGAVVLGWTKNGEMYFASSYASGPEVLWLLERTKMRLLSVSADENGDLRPTIA